MIPRRPATLLEVERLARGLLTDDEAATVRARLATFGDPRAGLSTDSQVFAEDPPGDFAARVQGRSAALPILPLGIVGLLAAVVAVLLVLRAGPGAPSATDRLQHGAPPPAEVYPLVAPDDTGTVLPLHAAVPTGPGAQEAAEESITLPPQPAPAATPRPAPPPQAVVRPRPTIADVPMHFDPIPDPPPRIVPAGAAGVLVWQHVPRAGRVDLTVTLRDPSFEKRWTQRTVIPQGLELVDVAVHGSRVVALYAANGTRDWALFSGRTDEGSLVLERIPGPRHMVEAWYMALEDDRLVVVGEGRGSLQSRGGPLRPVVVRYRLGEARWTDLAPDLPNGWVVRDVHRVPGGGVVVEISDQLVEPTAFRTVHVVRGVAHPHLAVDRDSLRGSVPRDVLPGALIGDDEVMLGLYADRSNQPGSDGLFVQRVGNPPVRHSFAELPNFFAYDPGLAKRLGRQLERRGPEGLTLDLLVDLRDVRVEGDEIWVIGEVSEPEWTPDFVALAPTGDLKFRGWRYVHGFVTALRPDGSVVWNHILPMNDVRLTRRRRLLQVSTRGDRAMLFYNRGDGIVRMPIRGRAFGGRPDVLLHDVPTPEDRLEQVHHPRADPWTEGRYLTTTELVVRDPQGHKRRVLQLHAVHPWAPRQDR